MLKSLFADDWKKVKKRLCLHGAIVLIISTVIVVMGYLMYMEGYSAAQGRSYFGPLMLTSVIAFPVVLICSVCYIAMLIKNGFKYFLFSLSVTLILILILYLVFTFAPCGSITEGHFDYVKTNVNVNEIHQWLVNFEEPDYTYDAHVYNDGVKRGRIHDSDWPECIKALNPGDVLIREKDSKRYLRVWYRFGPGMSFGFCVMEGAMDVPEYGFEDRVELQDNAFVWIAD